MLQIFRKKLDWQGVLAFGTFVAMATTALMLLAASLGASGEVIIAFVIFILADSATTLAFTLLMGSMTFTKWRRSRAKQERRDEHVEEPDEPTGAEFHRHFGGR